jgi:subtilisin family serine protease
LGVVAPGTGIYTTDRQGSAGYATGNYYSDFGGTSAACPHVAGVAALVLSANPNLTQAEVRAIIESTCTKLSGYSYSLNSNHPNDTWNNQVGHGLVNAYAAVMATLSVTGSDTLCAPATYMLSSGSASSWSVTPTSAFSLTSTYTASAVVKPLQLSGQAGTLTAIVNA